MTLEEFELMRKTTVMCQKLTTALGIANDNLNTASQKLTKQADLIERLSKDNLALVAKLDQVTGKTAPGTNFEA
jgi:predicted  nucleic acid-binding Zn-ribbon protein